MPTYLKPTINGNCGKDKSFWGGRDVECTPTQPSSPITRPAASRSTCAQHVPVPFPFPCSHWCTGDMLRHAVCAVNTVPFIYLGGRGEATLQTFQLLGHALA